MRTDKIRFSVYLCVTSVASVSSVVRDFDFPPFPTTSPQRWA